MLSFSAHPSSWPQGELAFPHEILFKRREEDATRQLCHKGFVSWELNTGLFLARQKQKTDSLASGLSRSICSDAPLNKAFAWVLIGRSICGNFSCLQDLLSWAEIKAQNVNAHWMCHIWCSQPEFNFQKSQGHKYWVMVSCFLADSSCHIIQLPNLQYINFCFFPPPYETLQCRPHTSIILSWISRPPSLSAGPFSTILDTKIPSFEVLSLSSCGINSRYCLEDNTNTLLRVLRRIVVYRFLIKYGKPC